MPEMNDVISRAQAIENLSKNMSYAMHEEGLTVRALAEALGVSHATIQTMASGKNEPRVSLVANVAEFFHVSIDDMMKSPREFRKVFRRFPVAS